MLLKTEWPPLRHSHPRKVSFLLSDGSYYILQRGSFAIRKMDSFGRVTTVKISGAELHHPWQGAVAPSGELYFCNKSSNQLMKMDAAGVVKVVSGFTLQNPMGVKFGSDGFGYLSNRNTDGGQVIKFKDDAVVKIYSIPMPTCSAVDAAGRVIVGTEDSGYLYMIDKDGEIKQIAGEGKSEWLQGRWSSGRPARQEYHRQGERNLVRKGRCIVFLRCDCPGCKKTHSGSRR